MLYLRVKNFDKYQHYKKRNPPWIKLYWKLLHNYEFARLQDASKMHLIGIWLLASRFRNLIPCDPEWIAKEIKANEKVDLDHLVNKGFIEVCDEKGNASKMLASDAQKCVLREQRTENREDAKASSADNAAGGDEGGSDPATPEAGKGNVQPKKPKTPQAAKSKSERPEHAEVREYFREQWKGQFGADYAWKHPRDDAHLKWILDQLGRDPAKARRLIDRYFADDDRWLADKGHEIGQLVSRFNSYRAAPRETDPAGFESRPPTEDELKFTFPQEKKP